MAEAIPAPAIPYVMTVRNTAQMYFGIPAPTSAILAQIAQESRFNPTIKSRAGAVGLMQMMPATGKWVGEQMGMPAQPLDPLWSIRAGIWYDRWIWTRVYYDDECHRWGATLSSYNGGLGWHNKRQEQAKEPFDFWKSVRFVNPGIAPLNQMENEEYPFRILYQQQHKFRVVGSKMICVG